MRVFSRGNEIILDTGDEAVADLPPAPAAGRGPRAPGPAARPRPHPRLHGALSAGGAGKAELLKKTAVAIPHGYRNGLPPHAQPGALPRRDRQARAVFGIGPAGTGKTYLAVAQALAPGVSRAGASSSSPAPWWRRGKASGSCPATSAQKIHPYLRPLYDAIEAWCRARRFRRLEENGMPSRSRRSPTCAAAPLADAFIILDEAQNTTREQMKMFLTRIGENSRRWSRATSPRSTCRDESDSGLLNVIPILQPIREISFSCSTSRTSCATPWCARSSTPTRPRMKSRLLGDRPRSPPARRQALRLQKRIALVAVAAGVVGCPGRGARGHAVPRALHRPLQARAVEAGAGGRAGHRRRAGLPVHRRGGDPR